jgi:glycosyltransferase involved in cell wall biosynthesis
MIMPDRAIRIGFACLWDTDRASTWSYTPANLRAGMRHHTDVLDVGVEVPTLTRTALRAMHPRWRAGRLATSWQHSRVTDAYCRRDLERRAGTAHCDAVLEIQDLAALSLPFFVYQDLSYDALLEDEANAALLTISRRAMRRRRERQSRVYERAAGVLAMSRWFARSLVDRTGVPRHKVHVVQPGLSAGRERSAVAVDRCPPRTRLLFVGKDFFRKGGDVVLAATTILRREVDPRITLTVAGPPAWPLPGEPPPGVFFLGSRPPGEVTRLYDSHDLFVMPSRLEPFGIVFAEAVARGLPCVGRDAYAMPEVIKPGVNGVLVGGEDVDPRSANAVAGAAATLATAIAGALADDDLYRNCHESAAAAAAWFSWERAGREAVTAITSTLNRTN